MTNTRIKLPRLLVHLHLYYHEQMPYFLKKLGNLVDCQWDLVVTLTQPSASVEAELKRFKPNVRILRIENQGYDVWPFLCALEKTDILSYDYIIKLHSKNTKTKPTVSLFEIKCSGPFWRDLLINPLLGSKRIFRRNLKILRENPRIGMLASRPCLMERGNTLAEDTYLFDQLCNRLKLQNPSKTFCAGTMFLIRPEILLPLLRAQFTVQDFYSKIVRTGSCSTLAHAIERIFVPLAMDHQFKVQGLAYFPHTLKVFKRSFLNWFFCITNEHEVKIIRICGITIPLKRKTHNPQQSAKNG